MRDLSQLHPRLIEKITHLQVLCRNEDLPLGIGECLRTVEEQEALYAQGRTAPGSIVTYARGTSYSSQHQWGIAVDFFKNLPGHAYDDVGFFRRVGYLAKSIGLAWGGDWTSPVDMPHLYLPDWGDTPAVLKKNYGTFENFRSTWSNYNKTEVDGKAKALLVDGYWGAATTRRLQEIFKTTVDGVVSDQWSGYKLENPGLVASFEWKSNPKEGSQLIRAIQKTLGIERDGFIGPETIKAMQHWLGTEEDGIVDSPSAMVKALQNWCNKQ